jgi:hypothetical protein
MSDFLKIVYRKAMLSGDPALVQLSFDAAVIDRYRGRPEFQVIRTDSAGRVRKQGAWSIDFGIAEDERTVHSSWHALAHALPEDEREHWAAHAAGTPVSANFLRMQLSPGSCFDDGDVRTW